MPNKLRVFEYTEKPITFCEKPREGAFAQHDIDQIERFNARIRAREHLNTNILEVRYAAGVPTALKTSSFVGIIRIGNWTIEILPKIAERVDESTKAFNESIRNLLYMLSYSRRWAIKEVDISLLREVNDDLFEVFIYLFAKNLGDIITRNLYKNYVTHEENLPFLKGKLRFAEHITQNLVLAHRFFAQFDEFSDDNLLNRILKYTIRLLLRKSRNFANIKMLQHLALMLDDVTLARISVDDFNRVHLTRLNQEYSPILELCRLFISQSSMELSTDTFTTFSFIFDMNKLFEQFIGEFVKRECTQCYSFIQIQGPLKYLAQKSADGAPENEEVFQMRPDIFLTRDDNSQSKQLIIDTKYKRLNGYDHKEGVSQTDLYQMYAYSKKYECPSIVLLYPEAGTGPKCFDLCIDDSTVIHVRTVNLFLNLRRDKEQLRNELVAVLKSSYQAR